MRSANSRVMQCYWLALAVGVWVAPARAQTPNFPDGPGKQQAMQACGMCHGLGQVAVARHTKPEWDNIVTDMIGRGAPIMENEVQAIVDYLSASFPKTGSDINVNRASAKVLADELKLTPQEADAVVRHREENGYFNKLADLGKVAGLDVKKLEAAKDRLSY